MSNKPDLSKLAHHVEHLPAAIGQVLDECTDLQQVCNMCEFLVNYITCLQERLRGRLQNTKETQAVLYTAVIQEAAESVKHLMALFGKEGLNANIIYSAPPPHPRRRGAPGRLYENCRAADRPQDDPQHPHRWVRAR